MTNNNNPELSNSFYLAPDKVQPGLYLAFESFHKYGIKRSWKNLWMTRKGYVIYQNSRLSTSLHLDNDLLIPAGIEIEIDGKIDLYIEGEMIFVGDVQFNKTEERFTLMQVGRG